MKKKTIVRRIIILILLALFFPLPRGTYKDGGTKDYRSLTYRIVIWNRFVNSPGKDGAEEEIRTYHKTSVFWFPDNFRSIDELWEMETQNNR